MIVWVKNKNGTSGKTPPLGDSWLEFWKLATGRKVESCRCLDCNGTADNGGHVIRYKFSTDEYIVPICDSCNTTPDKIFQVYSNDLVRVKDWE